MINWSKVGENLNAGSVARRIYNGAGPGFDYESRRRKDGSDYQEFTQR